MSVFDNKEFSDHEQVEFIDDKESGLKAIIAIHDTALGPAAGGIRMRSYQDSHEALTDVLRLSKGMTYKSALAGLPIGGGKTVIIGDPEKDKTPEKLKALGVAINELSGKYSAGEDVGINDDDMEVIAEKTQYVVKGGAADTAPDTALGVSLAMRVAVEKKLSKKTLQGVSVAVQGMGKVAFHLCQLLKEAGAVVYGCDIDSAAINRAVEELDVIAVGVDEIAFLDVDVFAPCALGGGLNKETITQIKAKVVCGAANNQLLSKEDDLRLRERDILFLPDYVINSGGIISGACKFADVGDEVRIGMIENIAVTSANVIDCADEYMIGTQAAADMIAKKMINDKRQESNH